MEIFERAIEIFLFVHGPRRTLLHGRLKDVSIICVDTPNYQGESKTNKHEKTKPKMPMVFVDLDLILTTQLSVLKICSDTIIVYNILQQE